MDPSRLTTNLQGTILSSLQAQFPMPSGLQPAEQTAFTANQTKLANAIANGSGSDIVTEVQQATVTSTVTVASVSGVLVGTAASGPGTGTATGTVA